MTTLTETQLVICGVHPTDADWLRDYRTRKLNSDYNEFLGTDRANEGQVVRWTARVLEALTEGRWSTRGRERSVSEIETSLTEAVSTALREALEWYEDAPEGYLSYYGSAPSENSHPWGMDTVRVAQAFMANYKFLSWRVYEACQETARDILSEELDCIATGEEDGGNLAKAVHRCFEEQIAKLLKGLVAQPVV